MNIKGGDINRSQIELAENPKGKDFADLLHRRITTKHSECQNEFNQGTTSKANHHWPHIMLHWRWLVLNDKRVERDDIKRSDRDEILEFVPLKTISSVKEAQPQPCYSWLEEGGPTNPPIEEGTTQAIWGKATAAVETK